MMSALPPEADMCSAQAHVRFGPKADSCSAAKRSLFDHLVGAGENRRWNCQAERLGRFKIDHQLVFIRRLHWQISWLLTLEDAVDVSGRPAELCKNIIPIRGQPAVDGKDAPVVDRGQSVPRRKRNYKALMDHRPRTRRQDQTAIRRASKFGDLALDFTGILHADGAHLHTN